MAAAATALEALPVAVLLVGRPNSGKSSLFNALTGGSARVGNFPGITVDVLEKEVPLPGGGRATIVDLPGTYSLEAHVDPESDEGHARRYLDAAKASGRSVLVAQVLDSTSLALNLKLTRELIRLGLPMVLLVTQRDALEAEGQKVDILELERTLRIPALWVSARSPQTRDDVLFAVSRWLAEGSPASVEAEPFEPAALAKRVVILPATAPRADGRLKLFKRTHAIDRYLMHPVLGPLAFLLVMGSLFTSVLLISDPATRLIGGGVNALAVLIERVFGENIVTRFLCEGILAGAGTVIQFLPQIVCLTVVLELIDASGYLARGAYLVDRFLRLFGLGGKSFIPLLMGHACAIPAITATRMIRDPRQRLRTMLVIPLMTCSARIPAYALLIATFFPRASAVERAFIFLGLYGVGLVLGALASFVIGATQERGKASMPLVLELPPYRAPQAAVVLRRALRAGVHFLRDVGTTIVVVSAVLWVLLSIPVQREASGPTRAGLPQRTSVMERSLAAVVGKSLEPLTRPLGFDWRVNVGLIGSFGARELMVSTMGIIFGMENEAPGGSGALPAKIRSATRPDGSPAYSTAAGLSLLAFFVLACQCASTLSALRRETRGWRWPLFVVGYTYVGAYVFSLVVYQGARVAGLG